MEEKQRCENCGEIKRILFTCNICKRKVCFNCADSVHGICCDCQIPKFEKYRRLEYGTQKLTA